MIKNYFFATGLILILVCTVSGQGTSCLPNECNIDSLPEGLIGFYTFSKGNFNDQSSKGLHLTDEGTVNLVPNRFGMENCAVSFTSEGENYLIGVNPTHFDSLSSFTISLWVNLRDPSIFGVDNETFIARSDLPTNLGYNNIVKPGQWGLGTFDCRRITANIRTTNLWYLPEGYVFDPHDWDYFCPVTVPEGYMEEWHHVAMVYDDVLDTIYIYLNGISNIEKQHGNAVALRKTGDLILGYKYNGYLDDVMLFNRALSKDEVLQLKELPSCCCCEEADQAIATSTVEVCELPYYHTDTLLYEPGLNYLYYDGMNGCDSILELTVNLIEIEFELEVNNHSMQINPSDSSYHVIWLDCDGNMIDQGPDKLLFEPDFPGEFMARVEYKGCTTSTECYELSPISTDYKSKDDIREIFSVRPNPFHDKFIIHLENSYSNYSGTLFVFDAIGMEIWSGEMDSNNNQILVNASWSSGIYFVQFISRLDGQSFVRKIIKQ